MSASERTVSVEDNEVPANYKMNTSRWGTNWRCRFMQNE